MSHIPHSHDRAGDSFVYENSTGRNVQHVIDGGGRPQIVTNFQRSQLHHRGLAGFRRLPRCCGSKRGSNLPGAWPTAWTEYLQCHRQQSGTGCGSRPVPAPQRRRHRRSRPAGMG